YFSRSISARPRQSLATGKSVSVMSYSAASGTVSSQNILVSNGRLGRLSHGEKGASGDPCTGHDGRRRQGQDRQGLGLLVRGARQGGGCEARPQGDRQDPLLKIERRTLVGTDDRGVV